MNVTFGQMQRPTPGQLAGAGVLGIVVGALGAGFARALGLFLFMLGVVALWRIVTLLEHIAAAAGDQRPPNRTVPIPAGGAGGRGRRKP